MNSSHIIELSDSDSEAPGSQENGGSNAWSPNTSFEQLITPSSASKRKRDADSDDNGGGDPDVSTFIEMERQSPEPRRKHPTPLPTPQKPGVSDVPVHENKSIKLDDNLPDTVTILNCPGGGKVYVVGTAHFSKESQDDVTKVIQTVRPDRIVVELCSARTDILLSNEETILAAAKDINFQKVMAIMKKHGTVQGLVYITLLTMSAHVTKELGMAPGGEFRTAFREAESVPGCVILLGDRPINVTMARLLASLSWWQCAKLVWNLVVSKEPIKKEDVENAKKRDFLEAMLAEMAGEFPSMKEVLVTERDQYLAYSLQNAVASINWRRPEQGYAAVKVVGVVGIGHASGIKEHFGKITDADVARLMYVPPQSRTSKVLRTGLRLALIGGVVYGVYKIVPVQRIVDYVRPSGKIW